MTVKRAVFFLVVLLILLVLFFNKFEPDDNYLLEYFQTRKSGLEKSIFGEGGYVRTTPQELPVQQYSILNKYPDVRVFYELILSESPTKPNVIKIFVENRGEDIITFAVRSVKIAGDDGRYYEGLATEGALNYIKLYPNEISAKKFYFSSVPRSGSLLIEIKYDAKTSEIVKMSFKARK